MEGAKEVRRPHPSTSTRPQQARLNQLFVGHEVTLCQNNLQIH